MDRSIPEVFENRLTKFEGIVHLQTRDHVTSVVMVTKRIPPEVQPKLKNELNRLTKLGVIIPVDKLTLLVSQIAVIQKLNGNIR